jgi:hypothetical protein
MRMVISFVILTQRQPDGHVAQVLWIGRPLGRSAA